MKAAIKREERKLAYYPEREQARRSQEDEALPREGDDMSAGIYLDACIQGKSCAHSIRGVNPHHLQGVDFGFCLNQTQGFTGEPNLRAFSLRRRHCFFLFNATNELLVA